jgi:hypothetical protein
LVAVRVGDAGQVVFGAVGVCVGPAVLVVREGPPLSKKNEIPASESLSFGERFQPAEGVIRTVRDAFGVFPDFSNWLGIEFE